MPARLASVLVVQALALVGVVLVIGLVHGPQVFAGLSLTLALSVVAAFVAGVVVGEHSGFVVRLAATTAGCLGIVALGAVVAAALGR